MRGSKTYQHGAQRRNNPTAEMASTSHPDRRAPKRHRTDVKEADRNRIPTLDWKRKRETKTVVAPLLGTVEKIDPSAWIDTLRRQPANLDLFASFDRYSNPQQAKWEWYEHRGNWSNRLIHADARRAMASLLETRADGRGGAVHLLRPALRHGLRRAVHGRHRAGDRFPRQLRGWHPHLPRRHPGDSFAGAGAALGVRKLLHADRRRETFIAARWFSTRCSAPKTA